MYQFHDSYYSYCIISPHFFKYLCILDIPKDYADYCIMNDFDVTWSFAFGGLTGPGNASFLRWKRGKITYKYQ